MGAVLAASRAHTAPAGAVAAVPSRFGAIDVVRGAAMVVMALDHVRFYTVDSPFDPVDLAVTTPALFATRWVTHFVAPAFVLLAGTAAFLSGARRGPRDLARFLATRGLWLLALEVTVVTFAFRFYPGSVFLQVIWAIGASMLALALLVRFGVPSRAVGVTGVAVIVLHNVLDPLTVAAAGAWGPLWAALHVPATFPLAGLEVAVQYPVLPWMGVLFAGYGLGEAFQRDAAWRRRAFLLAGGAMVALFLVLRAANAYGEPAPWSAWPDPAWTAMSFLNVTKYPPSLQFLLVTLGPVMAAMALLDGVRGRAAAMLATYGRVPLLYYIAHLYAAHALMVPILLAGGSPVGLAARPPDEWPASFGVPLPLVLLLWAGLVLALYPLCAWFAEVKRRRKDWWLSYL